MSQPLRVQLITLAITLYVMCLVGSVTWIVFTDPPDIKAGTASAYAALLGLPPAAFALYQWARNR